MKQKKYRLLKDIDTPSVFVKSGSIAERVDINFYSLIGKNRTAKYFIKDVEDNPEWFEEVKEEPIVNNTGYWSDTDMIVFGERVALLADRNIDIRSQVVAEFKNMKQQQPPTEDKRKKDIMKAYKDGALFGIDYGTAFLSNKKVEFYDPEKYFNENFNQ